RLRIRVVRLSIGRAAPYEAMQIDIGQSGELGIPWIHASYMAPEGRPPATWIVRVVEVVVPLRVRTESRVVDLRRQHQRRTATPTSHQLGGDQFPFSLGAATGPQKPIERTDTRLILAEPYIGAIATEDVRLRHGKRCPGLARIPEDELSGLD